MGAHDIPSDNDPQQFQNFTRCLLEDVRALERMLSEGLFESGIRRIGAEQEMFLVDDACQPAPKALEVLKTLNSSQYTTELARFNLEANLNPQNFGGDCLRKMETELNQAVDTARAAAHSCDAEIFLTGILPTLQLSDLSLENMIPNPRYAAMNRAVLKMRGGDIHTVIKGVDEINVTHSNVMLESCNTSFQVHFQVSPDEFARLYNVAQAVAAPTLAAAVNSPLLLGRRLWHETRVALFRQSVDARSAVHVERGGRPRVSFGEKWIQNSVLEIFKEDIARFRVVLASDVDENPLKLLDEGRVPPLTALRLHNGTIYRWNRACYGIRDGKAHLRIENRILPAGPTVIDEIANAAFFFGLMSALLEEHGHIERVMDFDHARANFLAAARIGLNAQFTWVGGETVSANDLIVNRLVPLAKEGLRESKIDEEDIDRYLGVIEERVRSGQNGAQWALTSLAGMGEERSRDERYRTVTAAALSRQAKGDPVHTWAPATMDDSPGWKRSAQYVGQFMRTNLVTVRPGDLVDLAASLMEWENVRHVPVEDDQGQLVGLVSHRGLLRLVAQGLAGKGNDPVSVDSIMKTDVVTVAPETTTLDAINLMRERGVGCLPVLKEDRLVGIVTERDFLQVTARLLIEQLRQPD